MHDENYDITKFKIIPRLAIIQLNILVKNRKNTTMSLYEETYLKL
jgi:hypothetical protein